jgi:alpha-L-fucosidase
MDRREFLQIGAGAPGVLGWSQMDWGIGHERTQTKTETEPEPNAAQKSWMELKLGMMVHFGVNTYYDVEWSDGTLDQQKVNPAELDTDQWCRAAIAAGMKYLVFVCKHHDGFCNWHTRHTQYGIRHTPFKKDILEKLAASAQKHGLKLGLYYSLWDRHEKSHDADEERYVEFMLLQLEELLSNYGPIVELWFDGFWKKQQSGWTKKEAIEGEKVDKSLRDEAFIQAWRMEGAYRWQMDRVYRFVKKLQPNCMVANNSTTAYPGVPLHPVDIRPGEKATQVREDRKIWNWLGKDRYLPLQIETTLSVKGDKRFPSGNWFWHEWDHSVASLELVRQYLQVAEQTSANLLLNVGPMANGKLRPEDEQLLNKLRF